MDIRKEAGNTREATEDTSPAHPPPRKRPHRLYPPYILMLCVYGIFLLFAFIADSPADIASGLIRIVTSRSVLLSDYVAIGGVGAALVNAVIVGGAGVLLMMASSVKPGGSIIMGLFILTGFAFFGKNIFNATPIVAGVWLYSRYQSEPFLNYSLVALLSTTLAPIVSEISFMNLYPRFIGIVLGVFAGLFVGFILPMLSAYGSRIHSAYTLYNTGFTGGLIAMIFSLVLRSIGVTFAPEMHWSVGNNTLFAALLYIIAIVMALCGLVLDGPGEVRQKMRELLTTSGRSVSDYYLMYGYGAFFNMGVMCALSTTLVLVLGGSLNGPTVGSVLTITGFSSFGKHPRNSIPLFAGAVLSTYINMWDSTAPANMLAILFSTGMAPLAGEFGWGWGVLAGMLHVSVANHIGAINSGLNLYNNGFSAGFVAMFLIPLIETFRRSDKDEI